MGDRRLTAALAVVLALVAVALLGPVLWPWDHTVHPEIVRDAPPSLAHPFGTARTGHDVLGLVVRGLVQSLRVAAVATGVGMTAGTVVGLIAGQRGGWVDAMAMRLVDIVLVVPLLVLAVALAGPGSSWLGVATVIGIIGAAVVARLVRTEVHEAYAQPWVEAVRALGATSASTLWRHVLPRTLGTISVAASTLASVAVGTEATLSYLGVGATVPDTSLGLLVARHHAALFTRPWLAVPPALVLMALVIALHVLGDRLAEHLTGTPGGGADAGEDRRRRRDQAVAGSRPVPLGSG